MPRRMAAEEFRGSPAAALLVMYSEAAAHLIYAAADVVLVPSLFEPCALRSCFPSLSVPLDVAVH